MTVGFEHNGQYYTAHIKSTCRAEPYSPWLLLCIIDQEGQDVQCGDVISTFWDNEVEWNTRFIEHQTWVKDNPAPVA